VVELVEFLNNDHDPFADLGAGKSKFDKLFVLETVQNQQTVGRLFESERRVEFGLRSRFEAKVVARAFAQILLNHSPLLVDLHRVDAHMRTLVFKLSN
jgi:hypothetical protein